MTLELLLRLEPEGGLVDLGCGAGVVAIAAAGLGWDPVFGVDVEQRAVDATTRNAERNGVAVRAVQADLREVPPPPARALVANMPLYVHEHVARELDPVTRHVIASGIVDDTRARDPRALRRGRAERARAHERERLGGAVAGALSLLDPGPAAAAGAAHGQLASSLPGGGLGDQLPQARGGRGARDGPARARAAAARRPAGRGHAAGDDAARSTRGSCAGS